MKVRCSAALPLRRSKNEKKEEKRLDTILAAATAERERGGGVMLSERRPCRVDVPVDQESVYG